MERERETIQLQNGGPYHAVVWDHKTTTCGIKLSASRLPLITKVFAAPSCKRCISSLFDPADKRGIRISPLIWDSVKHHMFAMGLDPTSSEDFAKFMRALAGK